MEQGAAYNVDNLSPELQEQLLEEMEDAQEEQREDQLEDQLGLTDEYKEAYPSPEPEEKQNQHSFLHKAAFSSNDTVRTTWLSESELGRPLFNIRFLLDMHDISKYYIDSLIDILGLDKTQDNRIANYFWEKTQNITASGMSNKGFAMNLNVTRKMDTIRKRIKEFPKMMKGGKR